MSSPYRVKSPKASLKVKELSLNFTRAWGKNIPISRQLEVVFSNSKIDKPLEIKVASMDLKKKLDSAFTFAKKSTWTTDICLQIGYVRQWKVEQETVLDYKYIT